MLDLRLLGRMELTVDGRPVTLPDGAPARGLLAWLALNPGVHLRDRVADELWPGGLVKAQRDSLKTALAKLRRALPPEAAARDLVTARRDVGIRAGAVTTDVATIAALVEDGDFAAALPLMRGDLLPELRMDWIDDLRSSQQAMETRVLAQLAEDAAGRGDRERAIELTRRQIQVDPLDERSAQWLMEQLLETGRTRAAMDEYERLGRAYRRMGVPYVPSITMQRLMATMRNRSAGHDNGLETLHAFRWDAHLDAPDPGDDHPAFAVLSFRISCRIADPPETLHVPCISRDSNGLLRTIAVDRRYWFPWLVDPALDPADERAFAIEGLLVDGCPVPRDGVEPLDAVGGRGVAYRYRLPEAREVSLHSIDLLARSRIYVGDDQRVRAEATAHRPVSDAEFRLTVSPALHAGAISVGTSRIMRMSDEGAPVCGPLFAASRGISGALARFSYPLLQGSGVTFEITRGSPGRADPALGEDGPPAPSLVRE